MKCKVCGEEIGNVEICPVCGTKQVKEEKKVEPNKDLTKTDNLNILQQIEEEKSKLIEEASKSVVKITKQVYPNSLATGTGFILKDNLIITNAHVICNKTESYDGNEVSIELSDKLNLVTKNYKVDVIFYSTSEDVAILKPKRMLPKNVPYLELSDREVKQGELVFTIGNPLHYKFTYMEGAVSNAHYKCGNNNKFNEEILQTTLTLNPGNSGGPVIDSYKKVVGMTTFSELHKDLSEIQGYGFCVKASTILNFINNRRK